MGDPRQAGAPGRDHVIAALGELIEALDRRVPHIERAGEVRIAQEAATLRKEAVTRIEELTSAASDLQAREAALSDAVMNDDGGPTRQDDEERSRGSASESRLRDRPHNLQLSRLASRRFRDHDIHKGGMEDEDRKSTRLNSSHIQKSRMPSSA